MARNKKTVGDLQREADDFNARCPVGTKGVLRKDSGELFGTEVEEPAYVLSGHSAVAFFKNVRGCYLIERFTAVDP